MRKQETGQALVEGVLMLGTMTLFIMAVGMIGRYGDMRMRAEHHLQHQLFDQARRPDSRLLADASLSTSTALLAPWRDLRGAAWLPDGAASMHLQRSAGQAGQGGQSLAEAWQASLSDASMARIDVTQVLRTAPGLRLGLVSRLPDLRLQRSLYRGTGHAVDEAHASSTLAASGPLWAQLRTRHASGFLRASSQLDGVDAGWSRPAPGRDWLRPIEKLVPEDRLRRSAP